MQLELSIILFNDTPYLAVSVLIEETAEKTEASLYLLHHWSQKWSRNKCRKCRVLIPGTCLFTFPNTTKPRSLPWSQRVKYHSWCKSCEKGTKGKIKLSCSFHVSWSCLFYYIICQRHMNSIVLHLYVRFLANTKCLAVKVLLLKQWRKKQMFK